MVRSISHPRYEEPLIFLVVFDGAFISFVQQFVLGIKLGGLHEDV